MLKIKEILKKAIGENESVQIDYHCDNGILRINQKEYKVENVSFEDLNAALFEVLAKLYGKYKPVTFNLKVKAYRDDLESRF